MIDPYDAVLNNLKNGEAAYVLSSTSNRTQVYEFESGDYYVVAYNHQGDSVPDPQWLTAKIIISPTQTLRVTGDDALDIILAYEKILASGTLDTEPHTR